MSAHFRPVARIEGYLPIEDHGLIGDGSSAALVGRDGVISWLCIPRFDSPPIFCSLLDRRTGGYFTVAPEDLVASRQEYISDTGILITELQGKTGLIRVTDAMTFRASADLTEDVPAGRRELLRFVEVLEGTAKLRIDVNPRGVCDFERQSGGLRLLYPERPDLGLHLSSTMSLAGPRSIVDVKQGDRFELRLWWSTSNYRYQVETAKNSLDATATVWTRWMKNVTYDGPQRPLVHRSAITLKLLSHVANGAVVAAPTSSLPESFGGPRNWDYRYSWIRDAAFTVYALRRIELTHESWAFLGWTLDAAERDGRLRVLYDLNGNVPPEERIDPLLEGYRRSAPVRWGNAAADQHQHDVFGEILDCAYLWARSGGSIDGMLWRRLVDYIERAAETWRTPDQGIWEVRTPGRVFTYSAALSQVALNRGARLAERFDMPGNISGWKREAATIRQAILDEAWDPLAGSLTQHLGGGGLDASLLALPLRRVIPADHPKMVSTVDAIVEQLGVGNGLLRRYLPEISPDGLPGDEGAFLLCSFWLVDNLALQGRLQDASDLYDTLCTLANPLGLLPEQIEPSTGAFRGNFPQALSHVGLITSGVTLAYQLAKAETSRYG